MSEHGTATRADIQGLRAIAVGLVVVAHLATYQAPGLSGLEGGFVGVDVFFVLSGFLITTLLMREVDEHGRVSLLGFYARRARRILPAATVTLAVVIAYAVIRLPRSQFDRIVPDAWWSALFGANWHFAHIGTSYFDTAYTSPLQHFWSLAVEEQFYLVWPLLMLLLAPRISRRRLAGLVAVAIAASIAWSIHITHSDPSAAYFSTPARAYELAIGALLAIVGVPRLRATWRLLLGLVGLVAIGVAVVSFDGASPFPGWEALVPTAGTALLIISGAGSATPLTRLLSVAPMRSLGDASYSLYLWHFPVILLAASYLPAGWHLRESLPVELALMLVLAAASYHLVEQPFRRRSSVPGRLLTSAPRTLVLWPAALALVLATTVASQQWSAHEVRVKQDEAATWWSAHPVAATPAAATPGQISEELHRATVLDREGAPPPELQAADEAHDAWGAVISCYADFGETSTPDCRYGDGGSSLLVAAVGDSHMAMWLPALDALGKADHFAVVPLVKVGCAPYGVYQPGQRMPQPECDAFRTWTGDRLATLRPDVIVTTARGALFMHPRKGRSVAEQWRDGMTQTLTAFQTITPRTVVIGDVPSRPDPDDCLTRHGVRLLACESSASTKETRSNTVGEAVARHLGLAWVPTEQLACDGETCPLMAGGTRVYFDTSHLTLSWVRHATAAFGQLLGADRWAS